MPLLLLFINANAQEENDSIELKEVFVVAKNPIAVKYSVNTITKMNIYLNPVSNADPLKAITILPLSTNIDETANPAIRGATADRSRVYLNGAPIIDPVRFGRDNGLGNFSLFNAELVDKQYIYASNPPLTFGNSSAGLVEIETNDKLNNEGLQIALSLSNAGFMVNKNMQKDEGFVQIYGNYQFDKPFIELNKNNLETLNSFDSFDIGLNTHIDIRKNLSINTFNYFINENYSILNNTFNFSSEAIAYKNRFFSVNNIGYRVKNSKIRYVTMFDYSQSNFKYGTLDSKINNNHFFNSLNIKNYLLNNLAIQYGLDVSLINYNYSEISPVYYYAYTEKSPTINNAEKINFHYIEPFAYVNHEITKKIGYSIAFRNNIFQSKDTKSFLSYQLATHVELNNHNRFILSGGNYHSYSTPNYYIRNFNLLNSRQIALDYYFESKKINISSAIYFKSDKGDFTLNDYENYDKIHTFGAELSFGYPIINYLHINISNTYIKQNRYIENEKYNSSLNLKYFIKTQILYNNPKTFNASVYYTTHPGNHYTSVNKSVFNEKANDYEPIFRIPFASTLSSYHRIDLSFSKLFPFKKSYLIAFASINNLFNFKNQSSVYYDQNYSNTYFNYYQRRIFYFGIQLQM
jgi:hypothetical protein